MTRVQLTLCSSPDLPVEAEGLLPETVSDKTTGEIESLPLLVGNRTEKVGDHFRVEISDTQEESVSGGGLNDGDLAELHLEGDLTRFKHLGEGMSAGRMVVHGSVGFHAGAYISGGSLTITGNAGDWLGAHMNGGRITVRGSAGHFAGAAYRGFTRGMSGGSIVIQGNAGNLTGARMRRGLIAVCGNCGDLAAYGMGAGTVVVGGRSGVRAGANMVRGTVVLLQPPEELMLTFRYNCTSRPLLWPLLRNTLAGMDCCFPESDFQDLFESYSGDFNEGGRGEILLRRTE